MFHDLSFITPGVEKIYRHQLPMEDQDVSSEEYSLDLTLPSQRVAGLAQNNHGSHFWVITRRKPLASSKKIWYNRPKAREQ